jgi:type VI secretion system protein ImpM
LARELEDLDQWLQEGIYASRQALAAAWDGAFENIPPVRFLYVCRKTGKALGGVMVASRDRPGRRFPFLIYGGIDLRPLESNPSILPLLLDGFVDRAEELATTEWKNLDPRSLAVRVDGLVFEPDLGGSGRRLQDYLSRETNRSFWTSLWGPQEESRKALLLHRLAETLSGGVVPRYAIRFPGTAVSLEVAFWMELCLRFNRRIAWPTLAVWDRGRPGISGGATLLFDELLSKYFAPVFWPDRPSNQSYVLAGPEAAGSPALAQAQTRFATAVSEGTLPLTEVLGRIR